MKKIKKLYRYIRKSYETWSIFSNQMGWKRSFMEGRPLDGNEHPIPWYTYPAIEFLRSLNLRESRIFEYGCGNSSMFWAALSREVIAVENNTEWARVINALHVPRLTIFEATDRHTYVNSAEVAGGIFDVVVVDGRFRRDCAKVACKVVKEDGMIIFDNADWYPEACEDIRKLGWFQIDFSGIGPINSYAWTTSVFLRTSTAFQRNIDVAPIGGNPEGRHV